MEVDEEPGVDGDGDEPTEAPLKVKRKKLTLGRSRSFKKLRRMKKLKSRKTGDDTDAPDNATEHYSECAEDAADSSVPAKRVTGKRKRAKSTAEPVEEPVEEPAEDEEPGEDNEPAEDEEPAQEDEEEEEEIPTFARRYFPKRKYYQAKFFAIRDTYNDRMRVFLINHSTMEASYSACCAGPLILHDFELLFMSPCILTYRFDSMLLQGEWWRFVAETMEEPPEDEEGWSPAVQKLAYDFLADDDFSFLFAFKTTQWLHSYISITWYVTLEARCGLMRERDFSTGQSALLASSTKQSLRSSRLTDVVIK